MNMVYKDFHNIFLLIFNSKSQLQISKIKVLTSKNYIKDICNVNMYNNCRYLKVSLLLVRMMQLQMSRIVRLTSQNALIDS